MKAKSCNLWNIPRSMVFGYDPEDLVPWLRGVETEKDFRSFLDIGSGNGIHSIAIAKEFSSAEVISIEPDANLFESACKNSRESEAGNLQIFNCTLEEFSQEYRRQSFCFIHCSMVLPFLSDLSHSLALVSQLVAPDGLVVISLFAYPPHYTDDEVRACKAYMCRALPNVVTFPSTSEFERISVASGLSVVSEVHFPLPYRFRDDELSRFKGDSLARRRMIEEDVRIVFNLSTRLDLNMSPVFTFLLRKF